MANPIKGEVAFKAGGETYKLSYSANAVCELEDALNMGVGEIGDQMSAGKFRMTMARTVFWAGLLDHHVGIDLDRTKEILSHLSPPEAMKLIQDAFALAFPPAAPENVQPNGQAGAIRPTDALPRAPDGTGPAS